MTTRKIYLTKVLLAFTISLIMTLLLIQTIWAVPTSQSVDQDDPYRVEEFNINTPGNLEVRTSGGHITVGTSNSNSVRVEMYVRKNGENLQPQNYDLEQWDIDISESGNTITAHAKHKGNNGWLSWNNDRVSISFVVHTPQQMSSDLKTSGGHIEVEGLKGNHTIATSGGHLNLAHIKGPVEAKTSGGHIDLSNIEGDIYAKTSGGHISAETITGKLDAKTSGGHINLTDISGSVQASTSGGSITADLKTIDQFVDLKTSGGSIDISIPENIGVDLQLKGTSVHGKLNNFSGEMEKTKINGQLNGGGSKITARTSGGTVRLSYN